jgi:hypothetical protein
MAVVYGKDTAFLSETFMVEKGKAYSTDDRYVADMLARHPWAFGGDPDVAGEVEQATARPGETRNVRRG